MPTAEHVPTATWNQHPCSCCCLNMGCVGEDGLKVWPPRLNFIASINGRCPQALTAVLSGTVSVFGDEWGDPPIAPGVHPWTCTELLEDGCELRWTQMCVCYYYWQIPDADVPTCGPYIHNIVLQCLPPGVLSSAYGCPHVNRHHCTWYVEVEVRRASVINPPPEGCETTFPGGITSCWVQNCTTCVWEFIVVGAPPADPCCADCPPCYNCPSHNAARCALDGECCGSTGCSFCTCPEGAPCSGQCAQCSECIELLGGGLEFADPSCPWACPPDGPATTNWRYHYWVTACKAADDIKGCNPTSCPKDDKDTGDFFLHFGCENGDYVEFACA